VMIESAARLKNVKKKHLSLPIFESGPPYRAIAVTHPDVLKYE
jgi:hypothetical protein